MERRQVAGPRDLFGNVIDPAAPPGWKGPDGMAFSMDGSLYVAVFGQQDVTVLGRNGEVWSASYRRQPADQCGFRAAGPQAHPRHRIRVGQLEASMSPPMACLCGPAGRAAHMAAAEPTTTGEVLRLSGS